MPVENINSDGVLMFNKRGAGDLSDSVISQFGEIHSDDDFSDADLEWIQKKGPVAKRHWRFLSEDQAKLKLKEREELANMDNDDDEDNPGRIDTGTHDPDVAQPVEETVDLNLPPKKPESARGSGPKKATA